jgi:ParB-like chromosome segregation protein Spo0J
MDTPERAALDIQFPKGLETVETAKLIPYARNARTHSEDQIDQIANSIVEFGFNNPILVDGDNTIIAGHGRILAAHALGLETVPIVRLGHLTETQRKAYVLADNQIALNSGWNFDLLAQEVADLNAAGLELDVLGFSDAQIENLLAGLDGAGDFLNSFNSPGPGGASADSRLANPDRPEARPPDEFPAFGEDIRTEHQCPKCGYQWSGKSS